MLHTNKIITTNSKKKKKEEEIFCCVYSFLYLINGKHCTRKHVSGVEMGNAALTAAVKGNPSSVRDVQQSLNGEPNR